MPPQVCSCLVLLVCCLISLEVREAQAFDGWLRGGSNRRRNYNRYNRPNRYYGDEGVTYTNTAQLRNRACVTSCRNIYKPVCGSDLKTYRNGCEFRRSKCISNNYSKFIYLKESCPSYITRCDLTQYCEAGRRVCGTDGVTYSSVCHLSMAKCGTAVTVAHKDRCGELQNLRRNGGTRVAVVNIQSSSESDEDRGAFTNVAVMEPDLVRPQATRSPRVTTIFVAPTRIVGDSRPYIRPRPNIPKPPRRPINRPMLTVRPTRGRITRVTRRPPPPPPPRIPTIPPLPTEIPTIPPLQTDRPTNAPIVYPQPTDVVQTGCVETCSLEYDPVCGTDDVTYPSACVLRAVACQKNIDLTVWYGGSCIVSTTPQPQYTTPLPVIRPGPRQDPNSEVQCTEGCPIEYIPVCGIDGVTYPSPCIIESMACLYKNPFLQIDYPGECRTPTTDGTMVGRLRVKDNPCEDLRCAVDEYKPVCGSDGKIYDSICELDKRACSLRDNSLVDVEVKQCVPKVKLYIVDHKYTFKLA